MNQNNFGLAELRMEGGKLWPHDYLLFNGRMPDRSFYSEEELEQQTKSGYTDQDYA